MVAGRVARPLCSSRCRTPNHSVRNLNVKQTLQTGQKVVELLDGTKPNHHFMTGSELGQCIVQQAAQRPPKAATIQNVDDSRGREASCDVACCILQQHLLRTNKGGPTLKLDPAIVFEQ